MYESSPPPLGLFDEMLTASGFVKTEYSVGAYSFNLGTDPKFQASYIYII